MKLFISYIKMKRRTLLMCLVFAVVFTVSFALYRLPLSAVLYPMALCLAVGSAFIWVDFAKFAKKHKRFEEIASMREYLLSDLPEYDTVFDEDYRKIITLLREELSQSETRSNSRYNDMTDYYTVWAHQIKTPIASMKLTLQNEDSPVSRKLSADLFRVEQYVEMVLAFLRLESTSTDYVFREHEISPIIKGAIRKFAPDFIGKKLRLEYEESDFSFVTDEKWFSFVLEQIISNSLKYTREGGVHIYTENKKLYIDDTGIGISPGDVPRIFESGFTGINGRTDKAASGIGLYLCKRICTNLGIDISVSSVPGKGTSICLDLEQYDIKE